MMVYLDGTADIKTSESSMFRNLPKSCSRGRNTKHQ
jgi:hypothetical protein